MKLTIFFDSHCPLCMTEMQQLMSLDTSKKIIFEDLHAADFIQRYRNTIATLLMGKGCSSKCNINN